MLKKSILYICALVLSLSTYAEGKYMIADTSQVESWERNLIQGLERYRKEVGLVLPEVNFDEEKTRVGYGFLLYDTLQSGGGLYAINLDNPQEYKLIGELTYKMAWAGVFVKGKYYTYNVLGGGPNAPLGFYSVDLKTGWKTEIASYWGKEDIPLLTSMAYDPVEDKVFGLSNTQMYLVDYAKGEFRFWAEMDRVFLTFAISEDGEMYGIDPYGVLCQISNQGSVREIGSTGIQLGGLQSMTFDPNDGKLYWAMWSEQEPPALCEVDVETGKTTRLANFGNRSEWTGFYIPARMKYGVPDRVKNLTFLSTPDGGMLRWESPANAAKIEIYRDGELLAVLKSKEQSYKDVNLPSGRHVYRVTPTNKMGKGVSVYASVFVGEDVPANVTGVRLVRDGETKWTLAWESVTQGRNGGMIDTAFLSYHVYRYPGNERIAVTKETGLPVGESILDCYSYGVQAVTDCGVSDIVVSNTALMGMPLAIPYATNFAVSEERLWTLADKAENGKNYSLANAIDDFFVRYVSPGKAAREDDLLISPPLFLKEGHCYRLRFAVRAESGAPRLSVTFGNAPTVEAQKQILFLDTLTHRVLRAYEVLLPRVEKRGAYHFGFQCYDQEREMPTVVDITNVEVKEVVAPEMAEKLDKAPAIDNDGETLLFVGYQMPNLSGGTTLDGKPFDLYALGGKLKIVDLWTSNIEKWQGNRKALASLHRDFHKKGLEMVSIACDQENREALEKAISANKMTWPQIAELVPLGMNTFLKVFYIQQLPCVFLLDEDNRILAYVQDAARLRPLIEALLTDKK